MSKPIEKQKGKGLYASVPAYPPFVAEAVTLPCLVSPDLFTGYGDRGETRRARVQAAKLACADCPFRQRCKDWATETKQTGVWGGTDEFERAMTRHRGNVQASKKEAYRLAYS